MSATTEFSSEGFDLDAIPKDDKDSVFEIGGGVSSTVEAKQSPQDQTSTKSTQAPLSPEMQKAEDLKQKGNEAFKAKDYLGAIEIYTDAIEAVPTNTAAGERTGAEMIKEREDHHEAKLQKRRREYNPRAAAGANKDMVDEKGNGSGSEEDDDDKKEEEKEKKEEQYQIPSHMHSSKLAVYYCNRAACYLHLSKYEQAIKDTDVTLMYNPTYAKAYVRRMTANEELDRVDEALRDAQSALKLEPASRPVQQHVKRLTKLNHEKTEKMKEETMGKLKDLGNSILGNFGLSLDNFNAKKDPNTGSYNISFDNN